MRMKSEAVSACLIRVATWVLIATCASASLADERTYPHKPIRWIVPYPSGTASDIVARAFAVKLQEQWRQPVIVDNRPGAATNLGSELVLKAPADGYTLLLSSGTSVTNAALFDRLAYDPARDFIPVSLLVRSVLAIFVPAQSAFRTFGDAVSYARSHPGQLAYGVPGIGSIPHLAAQQLMDISKVSLVSVPYVGSPRLATDLAGGHLPLAIGNLFVHIQQVRTGQVRVLLVLGQTREPALPEVPSVAEIGLSELATDGFVGVSVAAATPRDIVQKLAAELQRIGKLPDVIRQLEQPGTRVVASSPNHYGRLLETEAARWKKVIREHNIRVN